MLLASASGNSGLWSRLISTLRTSGLIRRRITLGLWYFGRDCRIRRLCWNFYPGHLRCLPLSRLNAIFGLLTRFRSVSVRGVEGAVTSAVIPIRLPPLAENPGFGSNFARQSDPY